MCIWKLECRTRAFHVTRSHRTETESDERSWGIACVESCADADHESCGVTQLTRCNYKEPQRPLEPAFRSLMDLHGDTLGTFHASWTHWAPFQMQLHFISWSHCRARRVTAASGGLLARCAGLMQAHPFSSPPRRNMHKLLLRRENDGCMTAG